MEQPTEFELFINVKTTKALGLTILPLHLFQADKVTPRGRAQPPADVPWIGFQDNHPRSASTMQTGWW
jgi:hypothetical protein